ncbi:MULTISPECIES: YheT family hydrolase [unclassified Coleofasciculus]|uniref:YheT family hydrolase n=1 Tax=unclassified Coleofasciculus TaxID=2692782 RepID=UPI00187F0076|nr:MULTISPECIES: alpha/beta fold hydrolase [unclassified Coleofasciculus]MBE9126537.1 alpha/beta fold hydrolase [Coleofasciculus sp. LEGE 07081]MBE9149971.1 alpha/beta fold hydrolase [Coleofasciculus sp. LEGE 07092]
MPHSPYTPPWYLRNGLAMTLYIAFKAKGNWETTLTAPEPPYQEKIFIGAQNVPIYGRLSKPDNPKGTIIGTYGITGTLDNQWYLKLLGRKAFAQNYAVVLFDWRAHGKTARLSPTLTSDGLYEGEDFVRIAAAAKAIGCPPPFWFTGYSLGGQLALWGVKAAQSLAYWEEDIGLEESDIGGGAVICPSLESNRSLSYLVQHPLGRYLERAIAQNLKNLARQLYQAHPDAIDPTAIEKTNSIWGFDKALVIEKLGFSSVEEYYEASSALHLLPHLTKPTLILYAADDPMFDPTLISDLQTACAENPVLDLVLTQQGGHVGYISSKETQCQALYSDCWWAWNRVLEWCDLNSRPLD